MDDGALVLAVGAGSLAAVNPCGFALLPAYLSFLVLDEESSRTRAVGRALKLTAAMTLAFAGVFAVFGLVVSPLAASAQRYLPWFTVALGLAVVLAGGWVLAGRRLPGVVVRTGGTEAPNRTVLSMLGFGASYAAASLTCTIAPFLAVVVAAFRAGSVLQGVVLFVAYALGMGLVVGSAAVAVALARSSLVGRLRRVGRWVPAAGGVLLVLVGGYVAYYGWWEIRVLHGATGDDPVIGLAGNLQRALANAVDGLGWAGFLGALAVLVLSALGLARVRRGAVGTVREPDEEGVPR